LEKFHLKPESVISVMGTNRSSAPGWARYSVGDSLILNPGFGVELFDLSAGLLQRGAVSAAS
jgi:hypothetical protein